MIQDKNLMSVGFSNKITKKDLLIANGMRELERTNENKEKLNDAIESAGESIQRLRELQ